MSISESIQILLLTAFGLTIAWFAGFFRRRSINGRGHPLSDRGSAMELLVPGLAGFSAFLFAPSVYYVLLVRPHQNALTEHQTICMSLLSALAGFLTLQGMDWFQRRNQFRQRQIIPGVFSGMVGALALVPLVLAATALVQDLMKMAGSAPPQEHALLVAFAKVGVWDRLLVVFSAVIVAPLFEELLFRFHLQSAIRRATGNRWFAVIVASAAFAAIHDIWWMMPPLFLLAVGLGYVFERTRNLWAVITIHALFNALSLTVEFWSLRHS